MAFWAEVIRALVKMVIIGAAAFGGILAGRRLRERKDAKNEQQTENQ